MLSIIFGTFAIRAGILLDFLFCLDVDVADLGHHPSALWAKFGVHAYGLGHWPAHDMFDIFWLLRRLYLAFYTATASATHL
jgi:hypothetical protein